MNADLQSVERVSWRLQKPVAMSEAQFKDWLDLVEQRTGINYSRHRSILQAGLHRRMSEIGCGDYDSYLQQVRDGISGTLEWGELLNRITIRETRFFRDEAAFAHLEEYLLQRIAFLQRAEQSLELWSAGCASGEETWSLALLARRCIELTGASVYLGVIGSDISAAALRHAREGVYRLDRLDQVDGDLLSRGERLEEIEALRMDAELRARVGFVQANLIADDQLPVVEMDVIFCQNVLIYFSPAYRKIALARLVDRLKPGGLLLLGQGESFGWDHAAVYRVRARQVEAYVRHSRTP